MEALIIYILKLNLILSVLYILYRAFLQTLSFYKWNRYYLLASMLCAFILPKVKITSDTVTQPAILFVNSINLPLSNTKEIIVATSANGINFFSAMQYMILAGMAVFSTILTIRVIALLLFMRRTRLTKTDGMLEIRTTEDNTAPFSFMHMIVIQSSLWGSEELDCILSHEAVHVRQIHTIDILLNELCKLVCWFNPFFWFYSRALRQNLEYIVDAEVLGRGYDHQAYQLCLLSISSGKNALLPVTSFNAASFKLRLFEMNRGQASSQIHILKYLLPLPVLFIALLMNADFYSTSLKKSFKAVHSIADDFLSKKQPDGTLVAAQSELKSPIKAMASNPLKTKEHLPQFQESAIPAATPNSALLVPAGANWHAAMSGTSIVVTIKGTLIEVTGNEGFAEIDNRETTYPHNIVLVNFPDAILIYEGKEYPLNEFKNSIDPTHIIQTKVFLGKAATKVFGAKGKKGVVLAWSAPT